MKDFISVDEARAIIESAVRSIAQEVVGESVPLRESVGRTLSRDIRSGSDHPPFRNSAMDGYAVAAADAALRSFRVVGESRAGAAFSGVIESGNAVKISTGAVVPEGTTAVVPIERVQQDESGTIKVDAEVVGGHHIRDAGRDVRRGSIAFSAGSVITTSAIPLLAMLGCDTVRVSVPPRVAIVTTGDELVDIKVADPLPLGMIRDSNAAGLGALVRASGGDVAITKRAADSAESLQNALAATREAEILIISGGVSMGEHDYVRPALAERGVDLLFWRIRQRPGKPLAFGVASHQVVFALPGNPVSSAVCFDQYVRPVIHTMLGRRESAAEESIALLDQPVNAREGLHHFIRGVAWIDASAILRVKPTGAQDSNLVTSVTRADCLIHVPESAPRPNVGDRVRVTWLRDY